ncbi:MAG: DUF1015 domain-containing protein [Phycisphaerales bacterium]|nr:MAG: DUF1015 domain-containing protein [Phycisphaerales bacterium]
MPAVYPFRAVQYQGGSGDVSAVVAPPYDVLDAKSRAALLAKNDANVVGIDLPHVPAKELGPPEAYAKAADSYRAMLLSGTLERCEKPAIFAYRQNFSFRGEKYQRCGMACCVETQPLGPREGGGVLPHEQTFSGPKEDRLALMKAAQAQFSPIFGMHPDEDGAATALVREIMDSRKADMTADMGDGVTHEVWTVDDEATIAKYAEALAGEDIFIADGHHRYNTAVNYLQHLESEGQVPTDHPARRCMFVMVSMSDPGLAIGPTHRVLGGMQDYTIERFEEAAGAHLNIEACDNDPLKIEDAMDKRADRSDTPNVFGIYDFATGLCFTATPAGNDPLSDRFPEKPEAWRTLDVALAQHLIVEEICEPEMNRGEPVKWAFPHSMPEVLAIGKGEETGAAISGGGRAQVAIIVRPTPLDAVRDICKANELMPQKSTFFYPKLATGLFINPLA